MNSAQMQSRYHTAGKVETVEALRLIMDPLPFLVLKLPDSFPAPVQVRGVAPKDPFSFLWAESAIMPLKSSQSP